MASKTPEIQADALLNLVLDEKALKGQLQSALGTSIREAAKNANLGDALASPQKLQQLRRNLQQTFQGLGKDLGEAMNLSQSDALKNLLDKTRRETVKKFERDMNDLLSGKGRAATRSLPGLPQIGKEVADELRQAIRVFGKDSLRSGSYQQRGESLVQAQRNVAEINKVLTELAGIPAVAAKDLQKIRSLVNDKDTGRYLRMQKEERAGLAKSSQALQLQTQNLNKLANTLSKMGFGDAASEIKAANQARKALVSEFSRISNPQAVDARARQEAVAQARVDRQQQQAQRRALAREVKQREQAQRAGGTYQTIFGSRTPGQITPGLAATMDNATRARLGLPSREAARAASLRSMAPSAEERRLNAWFNSADRSASSPLDQIQQNISRAAAARQARQAQEQQAALARYNEQVRQQGERQLAAQEAYRKQQEKIQQKDIRDQQQAAEMQQRARANYARQTASYRDAQRVIGGVGGIGRLSDSLDIGIVRGGLSTAYNQARVRASLAAQQHGMESSQYAQALNDLNGIRAQRDQLAARIREIRSGGAGGAGGTGGGGRGQPREYSAAANLLGTFGRYAIGYGGLYQVLNAVTKLKDEIIELDRAFYSIKAVTQATDVEMQSISRSIKEVALNTNFTTKEIAGAAEILGQAGVAPADMDKVLSSTAQFASATNSSLQVAADLMTTVRTVFKTLDDSTIADQLTKAVNLSKLTAEDLQTILSLTSQTAASYNVNLQQLLSAVTTLRNAGIKPSTVATGLRQAMLEVFNPDTATMKALSARYKEMGGADAELSGAQIQQRFFGFTNAQNPLLAALTELRRIGFTNEGQKTLQRGVDIRAFNAIQGLLQNFKELEAAESKITFGQAAAEGANIQMQSLSATLENLGASVTVLAEQMSHGLVRQLAAGAKEATNLIERLTELDLEMKATGEGSLNQILAGAAGGGIAGIAAGSTFRGKVLGGLTGAVSGGYLAGGYNLDQGEGLSAVDVAGIVATVLALGRMLKWVGAISKGLSGAAAAVGIGRGAAALGGIGAGATAAASFGAKLLPVIGWVTTAVSVLGILADVIGSDDAAKLKAQAEAAANQASKIRKSLEDNTATVEAFNPNSASPKEGTAAEGFARYRDQVTNFSLDLQQTFGEIAADRVGQLGDALKSYAQLTLSQRQAGPARAAIEQALGRPLDDKIDDQILFSLGVQREAIDATVQAFVDNTRQTINAVTERIRAARDSGSEITKADQAMSDAFSANAEELQKIIDGTSDLNPEEIQTKLTEFYSRFVELVDERPKLQAEARVKQMSALADQLAVALANSDNSAEIAQAVSQIGNSLEYISLSAQDRLNSILRGLGTATAQIDQQIADLESQRPDIIHRGTTALWRALGSPNQMAEEEEAQRQARLAQLRTQRAAIQGQEARARSQFDLQQRQQEQRNTETRNQAADRAASLISGFNDKEGRISSALSNPQMLRDVQLTPQQIDYLQKNRQAILSGDAGLFGRLASTEVNAKGDVVMTEEFQKLDKIFNLLAGNLARVTEAQQRAARDQGNLVTVDMLKQKTEAETAIKKADYGKNFSLLSSDTPENPVVQLFDAQRQILEKELAQAKAKAADAKDDGSKTAVARQQAVLEAQAKLDTLGLEKQQELAKYAARAKTAGEQAQKKADTEAKKQATIAVTQTGIEQRIKKQNFDEAVRTGNIDSFLKLSQEYEAVQQKLRDQLETELKARGYNAEQILAEIKLRQDLNKPLAEQVENIRKLASQRSEQRNLEFRDIGSGPNLGSRFNTAYLGADGFTTEEQAAAAIRDITLLQAKRAQVAADAANPLFAKDAETTAKLNKELEELDSQLGSTQAALDKMTAGAADSIYAAFSPRNLIIELEQSGSTFEHLGESLRSSVGGALKDIGAGLAQAINSGEKFSDVLKQIINQSATKMLGDMFSTNLIEGGKGLLKGVTGADGGPGGLSGILGSISGGFSNLFGFGGDKKKGGQAGAEQGGGGGLGGMLSGLFGLGGGGGDAAGAAAAMAQSTVGTMNVQAGSVTIMGGAGALGGTPGTVPSAAPGGGAGATTNGTPAGVASQPGGGGSFMGAFGGGLAGFGIGAALGGALGGKKGSKWGGIAGALIGAYFGYGGFGMAGGGHITKSGMVVGSGPRGVDSVPVSVKGTNQHGLLAPGEGVLNVKAMDALGSGWLNAANNGKLFRKAVGGVIDQSYNATQRAQAAAARSVAQSSGGNGEGVTVNLKNVNITDKSQVFSALQTKEGEDLMINRLQARGALNNSKG